jgi:CBS domain containing-hemolysin-like protein
MAAYFALAETAVTSASRIRLKVRSDRGERRAEQALSVMDRFDQAIAAILIGTNIVHLAAATLTTVTVIRTWGSQWVALGTALCTVAVFFAGEMLPKSIAKRYSERCALAVAPSLCFFMRIFAPLAAALSTVGELASRIFKGEPEITVTEDELYDIIETMTDEGELDHQQGELIHSALEFGDVTVERVFTPRVDLAALDADATHDEILSAIRRVRHSRLPVYEGNIDNIIGVLQIRRYIRSFLRTGEPPALRSLLDAPCYVHESASVDELLEELSRRKLSMAVVTDNYGGTAGVITVEDILEELVGEIWDEEDVAHEAFAALPDGTWEVSADLDMEDLFDRLDYPDPENTDWEHKPVGEWVYEQFDMIPAQGDSFTWHDLRVSVAAMEHRRILKLRVARLSSVEKGGGEST